METPYWLISPDNDTSLAFNRQIEIEAWPVEGRIEGFDVAARRPAAREVDTLEQSDLPRIVELINATHGGREMFLPYSVESFQRRLSAARATRCGSGGVTVRGGASSRPRACGTSVDL